jgi:cytidylate kinase
MKDAGTQVIAISRQISCGGTFIAKSVANRLGYQYVDRDVLYEAAKNLGTDVRDLAGMEERSSDFWEDLFRAFSFGTPESPYPVPSRRPVYCRDLFNAESSIIRRVAASHNTVILGRGAGQILAGHPGLLNLFLHAPEQERVARLTDVLHDAEAAAQTVKDSDANRRKFMHDMVGVDWTDARNYHLCIDTSATDFQSVADMILHLAGKRLG